MNQKKTKDKHLRDKLNRVFSPILLIGNILSIIITYAVSLYLLYYFSDLKSVINIFKELNKNEIIPILNQAELLTISTFQNYFNALYKIENFFQFLKNNLNTSYADDLNLINLVTLRKNPNNFEKIKNNLNYGLWGIDNNIENFTEDILLKKNVLLLNSAIPLLKSIYTQINTRKHFIDRIFIIFQERELYFEYPYYKDLKFTSYRNKVSCKNKNNNLDLFPNFMDYHCQNWFIDAYYLFNKTNNNFYISPPHDLYNNSILTGIIQCIKGKSIFNEKNIDENQFILYCFDIFYDDIEEKLHEINSLLNGYIFISRIYNHQSFYYPRIFYKNLYNLTSHDEFNENSSYYLEDLYIYINKSESMTKMYKKEDIDENGFVADVNETEFCSEDKVWEFKIYPIYFRNESNIFNLLNIIFVKEKFEIEKHLETLIKLRYIIYLSVIFLPEIVLIFIFIKYLVSIIGQNIVLPIKSIKNVLKNMEKEKEITIFNQNNNSQNDEQNNTDENTNLITIDSQKYNSNFKNNYQENNSDSDSDFEEEYINIRSKDIQDLFCKLINVRDSLESLYFNSHKNSQINLQNMLFSTKIFEEINNKKAFSVSNSNIGNLLLNAKKYDLAIMHLLETDFYFEEEKIYKDVKFDIEKYKILIESRYPKLIYNFKKYFGNLKKIEKIKNEKNSYAFNSQKINKRIINEFELFSSRQKHLLSQYNEILDKYISLTQIQTNLTNTYSNLINAYLEKVEFYIKTFLNEETATSQNFSIIHMMLSKIKQYIKLNKDYLNPKYLMKSLLTDFENSNVEIPNEIYIQKLNYLKGLLSYKSYQYLEAIKYFIRVTDGIGKKVNDANISIKSIKKLISISSLIYSKYDKLNKFHQEKEMIQKYINLKINEIKKFYIINKDIIFVISSNTLSTFIESAFEKTRYIIDNYITLEDRFSVTLGNESELKIISKLDFKNSSSHEYIIDFIKNLTKNDFFIENSIDNGEDNLIFLVKKAKSYILKKNMETRRKTIIIFMGIKNNINEESFKWLCSKEITNVINGKDEKLYLILKEIKKENISSKNDVLDYSKINKNSCELIDFEEISELKEKLKIYGIINQNKIFPYEKYINI